jgi:signal peptidase II
MKQKVVLSIIAFIVLFTIDQVVKFGFANFDWNVKGPIMSLELAYNYGVAFSMFTFLAEYLKYIQLVMVLSGFVYLLKNKDIFYEYSLPITLLFVGGLSNILDRFTYGGVVDFLYWHYGFNFAIFNFADVMINIAVALIIFKQIKAWLNEKKKLKS